MEGSWLGKSDCQQRYNLRKIYLKEKTFTVLLLIKYVILISYQIDKDIATIAFYVAVVYIFFNYALFIERHQLNKTGNTRRLDELLVKLLMWRL